MPVAPTGPFSVPIDALAQLVIASTTFIAWHAASRSGLTVAEHVYTIATYGEPPPGLLRPHAMIVVPEGAVLARGGYFRGTLRLRFERDVPVEYAGSHSDAGLDFLNGVGAIMSEVVIGAEGGGKLFIPDGGVKFEFPPQRSHRAEEEDYFQAGFLVEVGTQGGG
jgi:hypothetical protein